MPGKPFTRAAHERYNALGLDTILERVADGWTLDRIAKDPVLQPGSRALLNRWLLGIDKSPDETAEQAKARRSLYEDARRLSAMAIAEDGLDALDNETDPKMAQLANYRAAFRLRLAEAFDRDRFASKPTAMQLNVNFGTLHLDALRRRAPVLEETVVEQPQLESGE
jgi:hypothetical protein